MINEIVAEQSINVPQGSTINSQFDVIFPASALHGKNYSFIVDNSDDDAVEINYNYSLIEDIGGASRSIENESGSVDSGGLGVIALGVLRDKLLFHFMPTSEVAQTFSIRLRLREV